MNRLYLNTNKFIYRKLFLSLLVFATVFYQANAQQNVPVTGYNVDHVADGIGAPTTSTTSTAGVDPGNYMFIDGTYQYNATCALATANILPANGQIASTAAPGLVYQLQPYTGNNALRVPATGVTAGSGLLTVTTPFSAGAVYLLSVAGGGAITSGVTVTITFTDATTQVFTNRTAEDWCNTTSNTNYTKITTTNYNRIQAPTTTGCGNFATCQYFAEMALAIDVANQAKLISSITVDKTTATNVFNVYAVGMLPPCVAPAAQPVALAATTLSTGFISGSFSPSAPAASGYLVVRYPQGATPVSPVNGTSYTIGQALGTGTVVQLSTSTAFTANNLTPNTQYDFYVYSYFGACAPLTSSPTYLTTNPLTSTLTTAACGGSISGLITVGPGGGYTNLTSAFSAISAAGLSGPTTIELAPGYDASTETYPISFLGNPCINPNLSLTIRPSATNLAPLVITSNSAVATIDLNGAKYVTIDGRPGGTGPSKMLSIINTNPAGVAIRFSNDAIANSIMHCDVQGQNTNATTGSSSAQVGVISFWSANATSLNGNDSNSILYCDIHATATGFPAIGIASWGNSAATPVSAWNNNNIIDHCNIYDFFSATLASTAIKLDGGSHLFSITNNRVFQTAARTYSTGNNHRAFWLTPTAAGACGFTVLNNFIGGEDSLGNGTYTMNGGNVATNFYGMDINHSGTVHTSVQGNTIKSFSLTNSSTTANIFRGISTGNTGHVDIGNLVGNTIGSTSVNGSITLASSGSGSIAYGVVNGSTASSTDSIVIANNTIAGISTSSPTAANGVSIHGIAVTTGSYTFITNNMIGSYTNNNSLNASNIATNVQAVYGISVVSGLYTNVSGNAVVNLINNYSSTSTATTAFTRGISLTTSNLSVVNNNTVKNVSSGSISTGTNGTSALIGIAVNTSNPSTVTGNKVDSIVLINTVSANATNLDGMLIGLNGAAPTHIIAKNTISNLMVNRVGTVNCVINGINILGGSNIVANNIVQLGLKADGSSYDTSVVMRGLYLNTTTSTNIYHNTVYIGGVNVVANTKHTYAFVKGSTAGTGNVHELRNNIFTNQRSNLTTGGKHYQVYLNDVTRLSLSNNVYYGTGTGSVMGSFNNGTSDVPAFTSGWTVYDTASVSGDPQFINPNGGSGSSMSPMNLHINPATPTPIEASGRLVAITDDYDGDVRSTNTPVDIGADAGNFSPIGMSIDSTVVIQATASLPVGAINQQIIAVRVYAKGSVNPLTLTALKLNTSGSTNASADLLNAKVYFTGSNPAFSTTAQYGSTVNLPNGTFYVNGAQQLTPGLNCFWVAYDTKPTATPNNFIDARLDSVGLSGNAGAAIQNGDPAGARKISAPLIGNYDVGVGYTYPTITAAMADLQLLGVGAAVKFVLKDATYSTGETFPIVVNSFFGASSTNTVTISPETGVTSVISANVAGPAIRLDGVKHFVIDGRQGGTGTTRDLTITNDNTGGAALTFINDASHNILKYTTFRGASTSVTIGVINFSTGLTTGNDSNTIDHCGVGDAASLPATLVQARGSFDLQTKFNNGNVITNSDFFNYWHASGESNAMKISKANTGWLIKGNSFYQTVSRTFPGVHYTFNWNRAVDDGSNSADMAAASLNNMIVEDNYFGGSAPMCGGAPWTETGSAGIFCSYLNMGDSSMSFFRRNTFTNMSIANTNTNAGSPGSWNAIQFINGKLNIDSNIIGSVTDPNAISISVGGGSTIFPIACTGAAPGTNRVDGNVISGIRATTTTANLATHIQNIVITSSNNTVTYEVKNNHIGHLPVRILPSTSTTSQINHGIYNTSASNVNITNNLVHNLFIEQASTASPQVIGIRTTGGVTRVINNTIDSLGCVSNQTASGATASVIGIFAGSTLGGSLYENNKITRLIAGNPLIASVVTGIYFAGGTNDVINRNTINSFTSVSSPAAFTQNGIQLNGGTVRVQNNMIRMGIDASSQAQTDSSVINGISLTGGVNKVFFNTVYIGGTGSASGAANTQAIRRTSTGADSIHNNIFANERSGGNGSHFSIDLANNTNLRANNNLYYNPGGTTLGNYAGAVQAQITNWKQQSGVDGNSNSGNPALINPTGSISTLSLHISPATPTPVEGSGLFIAGINDDYDGDDRSANTPSDIGADAGNFVLSDIFAPSITYAEFPSDTVHTSLVLNAFATITDASGVDVSSNVPRLYYKKKTDNNQFGGNTQFDNGWKYVTASNTTSPFSFTIDYTIINGGSITATVDTIQYFVVAQDMLGNVSANPGAGFSAFSVNAINSAPANPAYYRIKSNPLNGNYNVGAGQTAPNYATVSAAAFALSDVGVSGPVTFNLIDANYSTAETFPITIGAVTGVNSTNTVVIKPAASNTVSITGSATSIFLLNGADYVTIDGSNNGTNSRDLSITNQSTSATSAVIWAQTTSTNDAATNNTIKNITLSGNARTTTLAGVGFGGTAISNTSTGNGNNNNTVKNCRITKAQIGIYSFGNSAAAKNEATVISENQLNELSKVGIYVGFENNILIEKNTIRDVLHTTSTVYGISFGTIAGNNATPTGSEVTNATISKNVIDSIVTTAGWSSHGIMVTPSASGTHRISNNMISRILGNATPNDFVAGVYLGGGAGSTQFVFNTINMTGNHTTSRQNFALAVGGTDPVMDIRSNILINNVTGGTLSSYAIGFNYATFANLSCNHNNYANTGSNAQFAVTGGLFGGTNQTTLAALRSATGKDASSKSTIVNFVSASDLHLAPSMYGVHDVEGTAIAGITTDIDGNTRHIYPYMGAHEIVSNPLPVTLLSFTANTKTGNVYVNWSTANETNNKGFYVQRSADGKNFDDVKFVKGAGNSMKQMNYNLTDDNAFAKQGVTTLYYRLRQVDFSDKQSYSNIAMVTSNETSKTETLIYPNPFSDKFAIQLFSQSSSPVSVEIFDISGRTLLSKQHAAIDGMNEIEIAELTSADHGIYFIRISQNGVSSTVKVVKSH